MLNSEYRALKAVRDAQGSFPSARGDETEIKLLLSDGLAARSSGSPDGFGGVCDQPFISLTEKGERAFLEERETRIRRCVSTIISIATLAASVAGAIAAFLG